jgi:putative transposase
VILELVTEATKAGARLERACEVLGVCARTVQRWLRDGGQDNRCGPKMSPPNRLSDAERRKVVKMANSPEFRDLSPKQIVPRLADRGVYIASESTFYRVLREYGLDAHRERTRPASGYRPKEHAATAPLQVASWDITYLKSHVAGQFWYLYMVVDVWSRKILGWAVHDSECMELAATLIERTCADAGADPEGWVLHSDNGGPMKGSTMLATLQRLGVVASFSRPRVSDDNPFSEALFRTLKYRPGYPSGGFATVEAACAWVERFVCWYNHEHLHSGIGYVTPADRHAGRDKTLLAERRRVYERARHRHPSRWSGSTRTWEAPAVVRLNPDPRTDVVDAGQERVAA